MRSLRLVPYWSVHETLGVDAHNAPPKMRTRRIHLSLAGRPPSAAEDAADQFPGQPPVELWSIAEQDRGRLAVAQLTPPRDRPLHHRRDPLPQPHLAA